MYTGGIRLHRLCSSFKNPVVFHINTSSVLKNELSPNQHFAAVTFPARCVQLFCKATVKTQTGFHSSITWHLLCIYLDLFLSPLCPKLSANIYFFSWNRWKGPIFQLQILSLGVNCWLTSGAVIGCHAGFLITSNRSETESHNREVPRCFLTQHPSIRCNLIQTQKPAECQVRMLFCKTRAAVIHALPVPNRHSVFYCLG